MSQELISARKKLGTVKSLLKKGKPMAASQAVTNAVTAVVRSPLMKSEREEFSRLIENAITLLNSDEELRRFYPLVIKYNPGEEKALLTTLHELLKTLQEQMTEDAQQDLALMELRKADGLEKGQSLLDKEEFDLAKEVFNSLIKEFKNDSSLKADIADRFIKAERYQDAFEILEEALKHDPEAIFLYNRIGIAARKLEDFPTAERYYKKALELAPKDEYLHFNLGRLYFDMQQWNDMAHAAQKALDLNPEFKEASKMLGFARKKLGN